MKPTTPLENLTALPANIETSIQDYYDKHGQDYAHQRILASVLSKQRLDDFLSYFPTQEDLHILDAGCGTGADVSYLGHKPGLSVVGGELSTTLLAICQSRLEQGELGNARIVALNAMKIPFDDNTFDGIVHKATFLHFPNVPGYQRGASQAMAEAYRVLKQTGLLYILTRRGKGHFIEPQTNRFFQLYEAEDLQRLAYRQGFDLVAMEEITDTRYTDPAWQPWLSVILRK